MKMMKKILSCLLICALIAPTMFTYVNAEGAVTSEADNDGYLYQQDFSCTADDLVAEGWHEDNLVNFTITSDGWLQVNGGVDSQHVFLSGNAMAKKWSNYTYEADVIITDTPMDDTPTNGKWAGIFVGSTSTAISNSNPKAGYELMLYTENGINYQLWLYNRTNTQKQVEKYTTVSGVAFNQKCTLKLEIHGNCVKGYLNGECLVELTDSNVSSVTGTIGVRSQGYVGKFDNLKVYETEINYSEDFSDTAEELTADGWHSNLSNFNITSEGWLETKTGANSRHVMMSENTAAINWSNYTLETDVVLTTTTINTSYSSNGKWAGIFVGSTSNSIPNSNPKAGYELMLYTTNDQDYQLWLTDRNTTGMAQKKSETISGVTAGTKYRLKLEINGNYLKGYLDDVCYVEAEVPGITTIRGTIGLRAQGRISRFDNISVYENEVNYNEDFTRTANELVADGWHSNLNNFNLTSGGWLETNENKGNSQHVMLSGNTAAMNWSNYALEADVVITTTPINTSFNGSGKWAGLLVGAKDTTGTVSGYELMLYTTNDQDYQLWLTDRSNKGMAQAKSETIPGVTAGKEYRLKLEINGNYLKGYLDDVCYVEAEVPGITTISGTIGVRAQGRTSRFDNLSVKPSTKASNDYYDVSFYRSGVTDTNLHPYKDNFVFGGWYTDPRFETPLEAEITSGKAYAKWVDEKVLSAVVQMPLSLINADLEKGTTTTIRFISTVDCYDYQKVGFYITGEGGKTKVHESTTVYNEIHATIEGTEVTYKPNDETYFSKDSVSFITFCLENVPVNNNTKDKLITVTPYWVTADGTTVTGVTRDRNNKPITIGAVIEALRESTELFYDDFSGEALNTRWLLYQIGTQTLDATLEDEQLHLTYPSNYTDGTNIYYLSYVSGGDTWRDYDVSADITMEDVAQSKDRTIGITARQKGQTRYEFRLTYSGTDFRGRLYKYIGSTGTIIGEYKQTLMNEALEGSKVVALGETFNFKMSLRGNCIRIYLDGILIDTYYDEAEDALTTGTAGIYLVNNSAYIDNFTVTADYKTSIQSVSIAGCTDKTIELYRGHDINVWEEQLEITYKDGLTGQTQLLPEMISDFDNTLLGEQEITLTYRGVSSKSNVNIVERPEYLAAFETTVNEFANSVTNDNLSAFYEMQEVYDELSNYEIEQLSNTVVEKYQSLYSSMEQLLYSEIAGITLLHDGYLDKNSAKTWDEGREQYVGKWTALNDLFYYRQRPYRTWGTGYHTPNLYGDIRMVSADVLLLNDHMYAGVILGWSEEGYYQVRVNSAGVDTNGQPKYQLQLGIYDGANQSWVKSCYLADSGVTLNRNEWFNLCLTNTNGVLKAYVNGTKLLEYDDSEGACMTEGECAARISDGDALIDNFRVYGTEIEPSQSDITITPTSYTDNFEDETAGQSPSHWLENTEWNNEVNNWIIYSKNSSTVYGTSLQEEYSSTYLHVFEKDPEYTVRFMTDSMNKNGTFGFLTRMAPETAYVKIGYDAASSRWYICSQRAESEGETIIYSQPFTLAKGTWYTAHVIEQGANVSLYINDVLVVTTDAAVETTPGRLGFYVEGASMYVDDVNCIFVNGDIPQDGVVSYDIDPNNVYTYMEVEEIDETTLMGFAGGKKFLSTDTGLTWSDATNSSEWSGVVSDGYYKSIVKLHDGKWLQIRTQASSEGAMDSDDLSAWTSSDFKTWTRVGRVITDAEASVGATGLNSPILHVSTVSEVQLADGTWRIFCPLAFRTDKGGLYTCVYYSDDGGVNWQKSTVDTRSIMPGAADDALSSWSESKIIKGSDGVLRLYCSRNKYGCMVYTESSDGGKTWENMIPVPELQCAMSSFGVYEDPTAAGTFYMVWVNSTEGHYTASMYPRTRLCLAKSTDGKTWQFLTNIEWMGDTNSPFNGVPLYQCLDASVFVTEDYVYVMNGRSLRENTLYSPSAHQLQTLHYTRIEKDKLEVRPWDATTLCDVDYPVKMEYEVEPTKTFKYNSSFTVGDNVTIKITCLSGLVYTEEFKKNCTVWKKPTINWSNLGTTQTVWVTYKNGYDLSYDIYVKKLFEQ